MKKIIFGFIAVAALANVSEAGPAEKVWADELKHDSFAFSDEQLEKQHSRLLQAEQEVLKVLGTTVSEDAEREPAARSSKTDTQADTATSGAATAARDKELKERLNEMEIELIRLRGLEEEKHRNLNAREAALSSLRNQNSSLETRLREAEAREARAVRELEESRNRLMIAEIEVERLSNIISQRNRQSLAALSGGKSVPPPPPPSRESARASASSLPVNRVVTTEDMPIATVIVDNANLRTGPGLNNSPLMTVSRGTRLTVETRQGEWYRVISPTGVRAWVSSSVVAFGPGSMESPSEVVRIRGYDKSAEEKAFEHIRSHR